MKRNLAIKVERDVLVYAREAMGLSIPKTSELTKIKEEEIESWEKESSSILLSNIKKLAKAYKRQLSFFFLPYAPKEKPVPADFRTLDSVKIDEIPEKVRLAIRRAQANRKMLNEFFPDEYEVTLNKPISLTENPTKTGELFRSFFSLTIEQQFAQRDEKESLSFWVEAIEGRGIPVFQMDLDEDFRGFCLRENDLPPVIVLNVKDARAAKTFTLIHEFCHLSIKQSEIDSLIERRGEEKTHRAIEAYANEFAGSFLVPNKIFQNEILYKKYTETQEGQYITKLSKRFNVSELVIVRRLYALGVISENEYKKKEKELREKYNQIKIIQRAKFQASPDSFVPRNIPRETMQKIGFSLGSKAFQAVSDGRMTTFDLVQFLDIKTRHLAGIQGLIEQKYNSLA